ncbi:MAG: DNA repair protein RecO [Candidatus Levybacteria bacterium]|nr:DNA repair protein RecO [Candidatus Levybacteria bacterium]
MRNFKVEGIIIKRRNINEADRLLTVFSKGYGKIQAKAVGVRRVTSRRSSHVELLNYAKMTLYKGKSLPLVVEAEAICDYAFLKKNLRMVGIAYHICELIDSLCAENQENTSVFLLLLQTLDDLSKGKDAKQTVHVFEKMLLSHLGFFSNFPLVKAIDTHVVIEEILERKLKTTSLLPHFL